MKIIRSAALCAALAFSASAATLVHSYTFTGNANDGTGSESGTLLNGASVAGNVLSLDGSNDYVEFGTGLIPTVGSFSVLISTRLLVSPTVGIMESISQGSSGSAFYIGTTTGSGIIRAGDSWGNTGIVYPSDGLWHTLAVTRDVDASQTKLYIDGALQNTTSSFLNPGLSTATRFGRQYNGHTEYWNGQLDDVRIYSGALTAGEVLALSSGSETPEPWTMMLTGAGLAAAWLRRRREVRM